MKIAMPISSAKEIDSLLSANPDEFYCGMDFGGDVAYNRREMGYANLSSYEELKGIISKAHTNNVKVSFVINAQIYMPAQIEFMKKEIKQLSAIGVDNIITSCLTLMEYIRENYPDLGIIVTSVMGLFNSEAIMQFKELGASRVILPRDVTIAEIKEMKRLCQGVEFEVFIIGWKCSNTDCFCFGFHDRQNHSALTNLCCLDYKVTSKNPLQSARLEGFFRNNSLCSERACGACKIKELADIGIDYIKIVGRRLPLKQKMNMLNFINKVKALNNQIQDIKEIKVKTRRLYKEHFGIECTPEYCYF